MTSYVFLAIGVLALIAFCVKRDKRSSAVAITFKTIASMSFIAMAITAVVSRNNVDQVLIPALLTTGGLVCGLIGDITLDFKIMLKNRAYEGAEKDADIMTYLGMAVFGVGHILYIIANALRSPSVGLGLLFSALIAIGLVAVIFILSIFVMKMRFGKFLIPSVCYAVLLSWFVVFSIWRIATTSAAVGNVLLLIGSIMFIISDLILSMTYFSKPEDYEKTGVSNPESKFMIVANHTTYYIAQFLIALAILYI